MNRATVRLCWPICSRAITDLKDKCKTKMETGVTLFYGIFALSPPGGEAHGLRFWGFQ